MKKDSPLVSIPVITYNSAKTVLETLESIKAQTYPNIELIISDDCSKDNTVELCSEWIANNQERFVRTQIVTVDNNTGVSANFNRADAACCGVWVKPIAGDDILIHTCIEDNVRYINEHKEAVVVFSRVEAFGENQDVVEKYKGNGVFDYSFFTKSTEEQWESLVYDDAHIPAPTSFYNKEAIEKSGVKNDERLPLIEDEPKWINLLKAGIHLHFFDRETVMYRVGAPEALSSPNHVMSPKQIDSIFRFYFYYKFPARYQRNPDDAVERMIDLIVGLYSNAYYGCGNGIQNHESWAKKNKRKIKKAIKKMLGRK